jgi:anti-sigma factor RsiW
MDYQDQLKLQAYLDGELPETESRAVAERLASDQDAAALLVELRQTREALGGFEAGIPLPESRQFYWSKIKREIERQDPAVEEVRPAIPLIARLRRLLVPAAGLALLVIAGLLATQGPSDETAPIETALADPGAMIYHDYSAGATFVWLSYPADKEIADEDDLGTFE